MEKSVTNAADRAKVEAKIAELGQDVTVEDNSKTMTTKDGKEISVVNVKYTYHKQLRMTRPPSAATSSPPSPACSTGLRWPPSAPA